MKLILKIFPRVFLINLSIFFQPLLSIIFKGSKFTDPINIATFYLMDTTN